MSLPMFGLPGERIVEQGPYATSHDQEGKCTEFYTVVLNNRRVFVWSSAEMKKWMLLVGDKWPTEDDRALRSALIQEWGHQAPRGGSIECTDPLALLAAIYAYTRGGNNDS